MISKSLAVRGTEGRTQLVEFLVDKRVRYLEYLIKLHSEEGALWMNTIHLDRRIIGRDGFGLAEECLCSSPSSVSAPSSTRYGGSGRNQDALFPLEATSVDHDHHPDHPRRDRSGTDSTSGDGGGTPLVALAGIPTANEDQTGVDGACVRVISMAALSATLSKTVAAPAELREQLLPRYCVLAASLAELLVLPVVGREFIECLYGLLLEMDVAFAQGTTARALAQRNLKTFRVHVSPALASALSSSVREEVGPGSSLMTAAGGIGGAAGEGNPSSASTATSSASRYNYYFLRLSCLQCAAAEPSYDVVGPALFSVLALIYRRLCDYEAMSDEAAVRRVLSIDRRLQELVLARLEKVLGKVARTELVRQAYTLSSDGLFDELGKEGGSEYNFVNEMLLAGDGAASTTADGDMACGEVDEHDEYGDELIMDYDGGDYTDTAF